MCIFILLLFIKGESNDETGHVMCIIGHRDDLVAGEKLHINGWVLWGEGCRKYPFPVIF